MVFLNILKVVFSKRNCNFDYESQENFVLLENLETVVISKDNLESDYKGNIEPMIITLGLCIPHKYNAINVRNFKS